MVDIHSHILFGVDDGPNTLEETIQLLEQAENEGITDLISTSHAYHPTYHVTQSGVKEKLRVIEDKCREEEMNITIHQGQEIRITDLSLKEIIQDNALSLAKSKYILLELPSHTIPSFVSNAIAEIINKDKVPIIAHPERNRSIAENPNKLLNLIKQGAVAQITAGSLSGYFGKGIQRLSLQLVESNMIHLYGSDVHNLHTRPFEFNRGLDYLEKNGLLDVVDILLENNYRVIADEPLMMLEPEEVRKNRWWHALSLSR